MEQVCVTVVDDMEDIERGSAPADPPGIIPESIDISPEPGAPALERRAEKIDGQVRERSRRAQIRGQHFRNQIHAGPGFGSKVGDQRDTQRTAGHWTFSLHAGSRLVRRETDELGALHRVEDRADRLSMYATLFDDPDIANQMLARYLAVTAEEIRAVCADVFRPDNRLVITYLPAEQAAADAEAAA